MVKKKQLTTNKNMVDRGGGADIKNVEISKIITDGQMVRTAQDDDYIIELSMSMMKHGLLQAIVVKPLEDGNYQLQAGFHRLCAAKKLKWLTIPANIREEDTGSTKDIALVENLIRRGMSLEEEAKAVTYINETEKLSISQICDLLGKSTAWVQKRLMLPNLPQEVRDELFDGKISVGHAEILGGIEDPGTRAQILNIILQQKLTVRGTQDLAQMYINAPSIKLAVEAGLEKAAEIGEDRKTPQGSCMVCNEKADLIKMTLLHLCPECIEWIREMGQREIKKEE